jgi:tetratricopeptide (TPR) repeat protein
MKKAIVFCFIASICGIMAAQKSHSERLKKELDNHKHNDTFKVKLLYNYAGSLMEQQRGKGIAAVKEAVNLARKLKWKKGEARGLIMLTEIYIRDGDFKEAVETGLNAIKICEETNNNGLLIDAHMQISELYRGIRDFKNALYHGEKVLMLAEKVKNENKIMQANALLAVCYSDMGIAIIHQEKIYTRHHYGSRLEGNQGKLF